jgi:hypothetical protein
MSDPIDPLIAENTKKAIGVSKYKNRTVAIGDTTKGEWIIYEE